MRSYSYSTAYSNDDVFLITSEVVISIYDRLYGRLRPMILIKEMDLYECAFQPLTQ